MALTEAEYIWMNGELVPWGDARVHVLTHGLHYGTGVLEGTRVYATPDGPAVFRLDDHIDRLYRSAHIMRMRLPYGKEQLRQASLELVRSNGHQACYLRHLANVGYGAMGIDPRANPIDVMVASWEWGAYLGEEAVQRGVRLMVSSWRRNDANVVPPVAKATGPYLNSVLAKLEALEAGFDEAVLLSGTGMVSECSGENIFVVVDGTLITPPVNAGALQGITQSTVFTLAAELGLPVRVDNLVRSDLYTADEVFLSGTAAELTPVRSIDHREVGEPGPITRQLMGLFDDVVHGRSPLSEKWLTRVS
ncbi:branched chain amino acid aminotransferase [Streptomyces cinnamoneus]|uniref:Branched-chain-amino-acid aminotransferase n=1 Tax=Streptomyces cinnamoneus TaxID=53446 RepID=A0A2G1XJN4_STRCJ|nr:branched-chain amino acid transaminase [Streptomyces cinnamoneus]PHQ51437.1 branched chain amino acid aminotransferase [Streptomyces cinnamoneus]PPT11778.1 branched-chain amino acid transaminase [Streptomyces cinnamoneus]